MSIKPFRIGLIGAGSIALGQHLPGWKKLRAEGEARLQGGDSGPYPAFAHAAMSAKPESSAIEIACVYDVNPLAAQRAADEFGIPKVYSSLEALCAADLDAVDICSPNLTHVPAAMAALQAGKHVLCEKPLAVRASEVRELGKVADAKGLILMTAQHLRFTEGAFALREFVNGGRLGEVYHADVKALRRALLPTTAGFIDAKLSGGGPCLDIGVHALDLALWCMNFPSPSRVTGTTKTVFAKGDAISNRWGDWDKERFSVEDFAAGFVTFANGATLSLASSWLAHQVEDEDMSFKLFGKSGGLAWPSGAFATQEGKAFAQGTLTWPRTIERAHFECLRAFHSACISGGPSPIPWQETEKVIAILEGIYSSSIAHREIVL